MCCVVLNILTQYLLVLNIYTGLVSIAPFGGQELASQSQSISQTTKQPNNINWRCALPSWASTANYRATPRPHWGRSIHVSAQ